MVTKYISFHLYKGLNSYDKILYKSGITAFKNHQHFNANNKTIFYFPGWNENPNDQSWESIQVITKAFLQKGGLNLVILDYSQLVSGKTVIGYIPAVRNATQIGKSLGKYFNQFISNVQPIDMIHFISHSLGSQIMSYMAKEFGPGLLRLTALDPAVPFFWIRPHLSASDGSFVDVIHTDAGVFGDARSIGTIDFFPNYGKRIQPFCKKDNYSFCSHHMSWKYYAASINNPHIFPAKKCIRRNGILILGLYKCPKYSNEIAYMGYEVNTNISGDFYLITSDTEPYGLGENGIKF